MVGESHSLMLKCNQIVREGQSSEEVSSSDASSSEEEDSGSDEEVAGQGHIQQVDAGTDKDFEYVCTHHPYPSQW